MDTGSGPGQNTTPADAGSQGAQPSGRWGVIVLPGLLVLAILAVFLPALLVQEASGVVLAKLAAAAMLSVLPGWLYLQFIKSKGRSLYDEYVLNLFRLHIDEYANLPSPPQHTSYHKVWQERHRELGVETKDNLYRKKFEAIYGRGSVSTFDVIYDRRTIRSQTETFAPVLFATVLLALGWVLVLQPGGWADIDIFGGALGSQPQLPDEVLLFGFLGAYSFILQDIVRRYFRDDLKTGAYVAAVSRIVFVTLILLAVQLVAPFESSQLQAALGFMVGFFPQIGLQALQAALSKPLGLLIPTLKVNHPLSELDGLNIWYEARLAEEGIEDMQNLVSANLVDLMLHSRAPIARLLDWIDQAFLWLHLPTARDLGVSEGGAETPRAQLRRLGIRTASDLKRSWEALEDDGGFRRRISAALGVPSQEGSAVVQSILQSLDGAANFWHVQEFKRHQWLHGDNHRPKRRTSVAVSRTSSLDPPDLSLGSPSDLTADLMPCPGSPHRFAQSAAGAAPVSSSSVGGRTPGR